MAVLRLTVDQVPKGEQRRFESYPAHHEIFELIKKIYKKHLNSYGHLHGYEFDEFQSYCLFEYAQCLKRFNRNKTNDFQQYVFRRFANIHIDYLRKMSKKTRKGNDRITYESIDNKDFIHETGDIDDQISVREVIGRLDPLTKSIMKDYFFEDMFMREIADKYQMTETKVRFIILEGREEFKRQWLLSSDRRAVV